MEVLLSTSFFDFMTCPHMTSPTDLAGPRWCPSFFLSKPLVPGEIKPCPIPQTKPSIVADVHGVSSQLGAWDLAIECRDVESCPGPDVRDSLHSIVPQLNWHSSLIHILAIMPLDLSDHCFCHVLVWCVGFCGCHCALNFLALVPPLSLSKLPGIVCDQHLGNSPDLEDFIQ